MKCIGGSRDGKDIALASDGDNYVELPLRGALSVRGFDPVEIDNRQPIEVHYELYVRQRITFARGEFVEFWVYQGMSVREAFERLLRLYRPPQRINQYGEEER